MIVNPRPSGEKQADHYFFLWTITDEGRRNPEAVRDALKRASAMLRTSLGGTCRMYLTVGGPYDVVGLAEGIDDAKAMQLLQAVNALGPLRTTFFKSRDYYLAEYEEFVKGSTGLLAVKA